MDLDLKDAPFNPDRTTQPHNIDAEASILGGILLDPFAFARVESLDLLIPECFYISQNGIIFKAMQLLHQQNRPIDLMLVSEQLTSMKAPTSAYANALEYAGGRAKLLHFIDITVSAVNIDRYVLLVYQHYLRRQTIQIGNRIAQLGYKTDKDVDEILDTAQALLLKITQATTKEGLTAISDTLIEIFDLLDRKDTYRVGYFIGMEPVDEILKGLKPGNLITVAARPSMGKTSFILNAARNIAVNYELPAIVFSLEMTKAEVCYRLLSTESKIEMDRLQECQIERTEWGRLTTAMATLSGVDIFIDDDSNITVEQIRAKCRTIKSQYPQLGLVVVDHLQLMGNTAVTNRNQMLGVITAQLKAMAKELEVPVIAVSQLNRGLEARNDKRPIQADLRESGAIEQDSDVILMLYRDQYYNSGEAADRPLTSDLGVVEVLIRKHRNGNTGMAKMLFDGRYTRFYAPFQEC